VCDERDLCAVIALSDRAVGRIPAALPADCDGDVIRMR
jgi:hypothetical protein